MPSHEIAAVWPQLDPAETFLQVGTTHTTFPGDRERAREQFRRHKAIHLRNILDPAFLQVVLRFAETAQYVLDKPNLPEVETPQRVSRVLDVAFQRKDVLRWMEEVTGASALFTFNGRLTQTRPGTNNRRHWHDDLDESDKRRLALVINFSPAPYEGGEYQLCTKGREPVFEHHYQEVNEAILFLVDRSLMHQVKLVTAGGPRRVFAGWALGDSSEEK